MKLVLDLQGAQSDSRFRGIGRQTLALAKALAASAGTHEVSLFLNGRLPEATEAVRHEFAGLVPPDRIWLCELPGPVAELEAKNGWRMGAAELIREKFLGGLRPDLVHVPSLFEGFHNEVVCSVGRLHASWATAVTLHDLIPLLRPAEYMPTPQFERVYLRRAQSLLRADRLLAVSESSRREAIDRLQVPAERVAVIGSGVSPFFQPVHFPAEERAARRRRLGITRPFVLFTGGLEPRKNLGALLAAFGQLPPALRDAYQLVTVGVSHNEERRRLREMAKNDTDAPLPLGHVSDDDLRFLYSDCAAFIFPSYHEGFGLPALEAMACGAAVLGADATSVPEVINRADARFHPHRPASLAERLATVLSDPRFRAELQTWGVDRARAFTWEACAGRAWEAFQEVVASRRSGVALARIPLNRAAGLVKPTLAFVSPLPPERTGIATYASRLLPGLARHYDVTCVTGQTVVNDPWIAANFPVRDFRWFERHADDFSRILYQLGNSPVHREMVSWISRRPGVVMLHDFYLSDLLAWEEETGFAPHAFTQALAEWHGFAALRALARDRREAIRSFPANGTVLRDSVGVMVHSRHAQGLAERWFGPDAATRCRQVPFPRHPPDKVNRAEARARLGLPADAFVVCSFGWVARVKQNRRLLEAWRLSETGRDPRNWLIFVGGNGDGPYYDALARAVADGPWSARVRLTGFTDADAYRDHLAAADLAVQLRTDSRGETSGAIVDCLSSGVPLLTNAHGAAAELPTEAACLLPDPFTDEALAAALDGLWKNPKRRAALAEAGAAYAEQVHHPIHAADEQQRTIESFYAESPIAGEVHLLEAVAALTAPPVDPTDADWAAVAAAVARNRPRWRRPQLLLDVTHVAQNDLRTGIERATRALALALLESPPAGFRVELVRATEGRYVYARGFAGKWAGLPPDAGLPDLPVETGGGDLFLGLDWCADVVPGSNPWFRAQRARGVRVVFLVHDLLPVLRPEFFPAVMAPMTADWLRTVAQVADGAVCVSRTVADEFHAWLESSGPKREGAPLGIGFSHHGADLRSSAPTVGLPSDGEATLAAIRARPTFLTVGTVEPRKGHRQALAAFEKLWADGVDVGWAIVGKAGWMMDDFALRLTQHPERGKRLFWLRGATDEMLERVYGACRVLLAASEGEGFGLPLIEAAQHGLPILARDLPVFREVAGEHAVYFRAETPDGLAAAVRSFVNRPNEPAVGRMTSLTWAESAARLARLALGAKWHQWWPSANGTSGTGGHHQPLVGQGEERDAAGPEER